MLGLFTSTSILGGNMKRLFVTFFLFCTIMLLTIVSHASTLTVSVDGLENLGADSIWSYQMNWSIDVNPSTIDVSFNQNGQHQYEIVSGVFITNWNLNWNYREDTKILVVLADEKDYGTKAPLVNGELFTITYNNNAEIALTLDSFLLSSDLDTKVDLIKYPSTPVFGAGDHTLIFMAPVPIPTTLFLLASGLIGFAGIRRKQTNKLVNSNFQ
jgi:hypothetical protein